jgi:hypothetical protein
MNATPNKLLALQKNAKGRRYETHKPHSSPGTPPVVQGEVSAWGSLVCHIDLFRSVGHRTCLFGDSPGPGKCIEMLIQRRPVREAGSGRPDAVVWTVRGAPCVLRSVTIPYKNLIQYLSFRPLTPAKPPSSHSILSKVLSSSLVPSGTHSSARIPPSSLVPSSTRSSVKTPDTHPDPSHLLCHTNDITLLDPDPDPDL